MTEDIYPCGLWKLKLTLSCTVILKNQQKPLWLDYYFQKRWADYPSNSLAILLFFMRGKKKKQSLQQRLKTFLKIHEKM